MFTERSLVPTDPVVAFVDYLIEDYGDEWVTKAMYHYRWHYDDAIDKAAKLLPLDRNLQVDDRNWERAQRFIADRQIGRRALVGSTEANRPIIEDSYLRLLDLLTANLQVRMFLLGDRPGRSDFGVFGQLRQLVGWDPESARVAIARAPRVVNWVDMVDDLSWWNCAGDEGWVGRDEIPPTTIALLHEIGRTYAPFMIANAQALESGAEETVCEIDGQEYRQNPFPYQGKCLAWLRERYAALGEVDRAALDDLLSGTGCDALVAGVAPHPSRSP